MRHLRVAENPFHVLGLRPDASRQEVERAGQRWLSMLEVGLVEADTYDTPLGPRTRTADAVRSALAELRDPERRLLHELWASLPAAEIVSDLSAGAVRWPEAWSVLGWRPGG